MSSSSGPDDRTTPHLGGDEVDGSEEPVEASAERALGAVRVAPKRQRQGLVTAAWALPGTLWLAFYLVAPIVLIVLVSFWTPSLIGFEKDFTIEGYRTIFGSSVYWDQLKDTFLNALIIVGACLLLGYPVAYFLTFKIQSLRAQVGLFLVLVAPFLTSYLIRAVAWVYPVMGRRGAVNQVLENIGFIDEPLAQLGFSRLSVSLALIQLYILFMVTPLFFMLAQVDRQALESARDLGASWWKSFREVIIPQTMPGIVIGSIFVFVLAMGDYGVTRVVGGGQVSSVGLISQNFVNGIQYPQAAAASVVLVLAMLLGVFGLLRVTNLREEL